MRHKAIVKASSAPEAADKTKDMGFDWEMIVVRFVGEQMPDIYEC